MHSRPILSLIALLVSTCGVARVASRDVDATQLAESAQAFLAALTSAQRKIAVMPLADPSRLTWNFVPQQYPGVMLGDLDLPQRARAKRLLQCVLSNQGMTKVDAIVALEDVLHGIETAAGQDATHRDPRRYWLQFFGEPAQGADFALRLQGHHVSMHFAVEHGLLVGATPIFLGANPHLIPSGPRALERVLGREEDLARSLLAMLDEGQRQLAVISVSAPQDIVLGPLRTALDAGSPQGLSAALMTPPQREQLLLLIEEYVRNERDEYAKADLRRMHERGFSHIHFAWAGGSKVGEGHYYRIQGPTFVIEYDNTQNQANHTHTIYRDLEHDFGGDALRDHYARSHAADSRK